MSRPDEIARLEAELRAVLGNEGSITRQVGPINVWDRASKEFVVVSVVVTVDIASIAKQLASKAHRNRSRQSKFMNGAVVVTIAKEAK